MNAWGTSEASICLIARIGANGTCFGISGTAPKSLIRRGPRVIIERYSFMLGRCRAHSLPTLPKSH